MKNPPSLLSHLTPLDDMIEEAVGYISEHDPVTEPYFVAFSGGKDSIVTLELVRMSGVRYEAYYSATGIDPPELCKFIKRHYPEVKWLKPEGNFYEGVRKTFPPTRWSRWCCDELKKKSGMRTQLRHHIVGVRAEESFQRRSRPRTDNHVKLKIWNYKPVFHWLSWQVWEFIESRELSYPSLYDEGFERLGCVVCPFICNKSMREVNIHKARWPKQYAAFERAVRWWWDNTRPHLKSSNRTVQYSSVEEYLNDWYQGFSK
jgi:phosphoadenosine phosphosulfate reductase